jgi:diguanylate cyclase (GGDEF)-like protein
VPVPLRDLPWASRAVAYLMLAAAPFILTTGVVLSPDRPLPAKITVALTSLVLVIGGTLCWRVPERIPRAFWLLVPFLAVGVIAGLNVVTRDASTGSQLFYLWPVLYATNFLGRRPVVATFVAVGTGEAVGVFPLLDTGAAWGDWTSLMLAMTLTGFIVSGLRTRNERLVGVLETQALADPLTGLANRRSFDGELARAVAWAHHTGKPVALLTVDVDHFKQINDTWGHAVGDQALQLVATALRTVVPGGDDVVARLGGDEFVALMRTDHSGARQAADAVRETVDATGRLPGGPPQLSIGVALLPDHAGTGEELVAASDAALYEAKSDGRGRTATARRPAPRQNLDRLPGAGPRADPVSDHPAAGRLAGRLVEDETAAGH